MKEEKNITLVGILVWIFTHLIWQPHRHDWEFFHKENISNYSDFFTEHTAKYDVLVYKCECGMLTTVDPHDPNNR